MAKEIAKKTKRAIETERSRKLVLDSTKKLRPSMVGGAKQVAKASRKLTDASKTSGRAQNILAKQQGPKAVSKVKTQIAKEKTEFLKKGTLKPEGYMASKKKGK